MAGLNLDTKVEIEPTIENGGDSDGDDEVNRVESI